MQKQWNVPAACGFADAAALIGSRSRSPDSAALICSRSRKRQCNRATAISCLQLLFSILVVPPVLAADDLTESATRQQDIRSRTQTVAAEIDSIVNEFDANGLGGDDVKTLRAVKSVLGKLSEDQMQQVAHLLLQARDEKDPGSASSKIAEAYVGQKDIIAHLRALLIQYQRDQSAYNLAMKLSQLADRQNENLKVTVQLARQSLGISRDKFTGDQQDALRTQQSEQNQLKEEVQQAMADLKSLAEQGGDERLAAAAAKTQDGKLAATTASAADDLANANLLRAASGEKSARDQLRDLARQIAPPQDKPAQLQAAAAKLDDAIAQQKQIADETRKPDRKSAPVIEQKQADLVDQTDTLRKDLADLAPAANDKLKDARDAMQDTRQALNNQQMDQAFRKQETALQNLQAARAEFNRQIEEQDTAKDQAPKDLTTRAAELKQQQQNLVDQTVPAGGKKNTPHEQLAAAEAALTEKARDLQADVAGKIPDAAKALDDAADHMNQAQDQLAQNHKRSAAEQQQAAVNDLAKAQSAIDQAAKLTEAAQADLAKTQAARDQVADAMVKQAEAFAQTTAEEKPQEVADGTQRRAADAEHHAEQALQQSPPAAQQAAGQPLSAAKQAMQQSKAALQKGDAHSSLPQQRNALVDLQQAKTALDQQIAQMQDQLGEKPSADGAQAAADHVGEQLKDAQAAVTKAQSALAKGEQGDQEAAKDLQQAEAATAKAIANDQGLMDQSGQDAIKQAQADLQQAQEQAQAGKGQDANQQAEQARQAMASAMLSMETAAADARVNQGQPTAQGQQTAAGQAKAQGQKQEPDPVKAPGQNQPTEQASDFGLSKDSRNAQTGQGNSDGARADVRGSGQYVGLPPRDRQAVQQSQGEKYPQEYGSMVEQYYRNLSDQPK
jgi:hypothetical protein